MLSWFPVGPWTKQKSTVASELSCSTSRSRKSSYPLPNPAEPTLGFVQICYCDCFLAQVNIWVRQQASSIALKAFASLSEEPKHCH